MRTRLKFQDAAVNLNSQSKDACECKNKGETTATFDSSDPLLEIAFDKLQCASRDKIAATLRRKEATR